ncbi:hypothetical protein CBNA_1923 [Coxiella burnetii str. Namibia]|nr:hypothetical protein CBNA_1923 [Coxiella burnetii str. Namibia]
MPPYFASLHTGLRFFNIMLSAFLFLLMEKSYF